MQFLIEFAAADKDFLRIMERAASYPTVQGVVLDIDRLWLTLWSIKTRRGDNYVNGLSEGRFFEPFHYSRWRYDDGIYRTDANIFVSPLTLDDVNKWRPDYWKFVQQDRGLRQDSPFVVKVCLRPQLAPEEVYPTLADFDEVKGRLQVEIEARSRAQLSSNPRKAYSPILGGISIGVGATGCGTLGVIMTDVSGARYGVTCSHVAGPSTSVNQPSKRDLTSVTTIGKTIKSSTLTSCPSGTQCTPWSSATPNEIDAALVDVSASGGSALLEVLDIGPLSAVTLRASMSTTQAVEVMGRTSKLNSMQVGGLAAWYSFTHGGVDYCFKNLFEVESPYGTAGVIRPGDSGAPVCAAGAAGTEWAGMIAGRNCYKGYALYAESIVDWLKSHGYDLKVL